MHDLDTLNDLHGMWAEQDWAENAEDYYTEGQCHVLARVVAEATGLPVYIWSDVDESHWEGTWGGGGYAHVLVKNRDGRFIDIRGWNSIEDIEMWFEDGCYLFPASEKMLAEMDNPRTGWQDADWECAHIVGWELIRQLGLKVLDTESASV